MNPPETELAHFYGGAIDGSIATVYLYMGTPPTFIDSPYGVYEHTPYTTKAGIPIYALTGTAGSLQLQRKIK